jgi:glutamate synthase (NADPH/NADH) large chain
MSTQRNRGLVREAYERDSCGFGLLLKKPDKFLKDIAREARIKLSPGFASGLLFLSPDEALASGTRAELKTQLEREGLTLAGIRVVPTNPDACVAEALKTLPVIEQVFVNCRIADTDEASFNRKLFRTRLMVARN